MQPPVYLQPWVLPLGAGACRIGVYLGAGYQSSTLGVIAAKMELTDEQVKEMAQDPSAVFFAAGAGD